MPKSNKEIKQLLINDFGYEPVELESYTGQLRALKESFNSLQIKDPKDSRLIQLQIAIKDLRVDRQAAHQRDMIEQRKQGDSAKKFESSGNDILTGGANLEKYSR